MGVPKNGWFIRENPVKMGDLGVPIFQETPISTNIYDTVEGCEILHHQKDG